MDEHLEYPARGLTPGFGYVIQISCKLPSS